MRYEVDFVPDVVFEYTQHAGNLSRDFQRSMRSRLVVFEEMLETAPTAADRAAVERIIFNSCLYLAATDMRETIPRVRQALAPAGSSVSFARRVAWLTGFAREQLRLMTARVS